jgi:hypothetical protein
MARKISKVLFYICNACQAVFNEGPPAKQHWREQHGSAAKAAPARRGRPRRG